MQVCLRLLPPTAGSSELSGARGKVASARLLRGRGGQGDAP